MRDPSADHRHDDVDEGDPTRPVRLKVNPSHANVENVVNPPSTPTAIGVMTATDRWPRASVRNRPSTNAPDRLMASVAYGKCD